MTDLSLCKAVLFDFDGTLADTMSTIVKVATTVLLDWGLPPEELGDVSRLVGPPFPDAFSDIYGLSVEEALDVTERYRAIYTTKGVEAWPVFPGIAQTLRQLKAAGKRLGVVSSKRSDLVLRGVRDNGLEDVFELVQGRGESGELSKADYLRLSMERMGVGAHETVYVGDRHFDVEAAQAVGVACVGVLWGKTAPRKELADAGATAICEAVGELGPLLIGGSAC